MAGRSIPHVREISVRGARTHNLKCIDLDLPTRQLIVVTGVSGSGKSSLAFDTVYAEGQRRYVESLSAYARQFLERMPKPDIDSMKGICPAVAIRQKNSHRNPRSTVGTTTEIHDYLRLLFSRIGLTICRECGKSVVRETAEVVAERLGGLSSGTRLLLGFEMPCDEVDVALQALRAKGFRRLIIDAQVVVLDDVDPDTLIDQSVLKVVVDRVRVKGTTRARFTDSIETAYLEGNGAAFAVEVDEPMTVHRFSEQFECRPCGIRYEVPQPRLFSFNNPFGACTTCHGFGNVIRLDLDLVVPDQSKSIQRDAIEPWSKPHYKSHLASLKRVAKSSGVRLDVPWSELTEGERNFVVEGNGSSYRGIEGFFKRLEKKKYKVHVRVFLSRYRSHLTCHDCKGVRLRREAREIQVNGQTIDAICRLTVHEALKFFSEFVCEEGARAVIEKILREVCRRLSFLSDVGLDYLTLDRLSSTLSRGEAQRINLATSLGSSLVGTLYVLDEPSIGLHPRDNKRLITILQKLRDQGNTILVVEHDADMIRVADYVVDLGLGGGEQGGKLVYAGKFDELIHDRGSLTAKYLRSDLAIPVPSKRRKGSGKKLRLLGAREHNLKNIDVDIPLNTLTCVTGVSGSGKSTLVHDVLYAAIKRVKGPWDRRVGTHDDIEGTHLLSDVVLVDQAPIGRTPRSNPVTYLKAFGPIRELFALTKDAQARGLRPGAFSFNVTGGRCDECEGQGQLKIEMQFLADVFVPCESCDGKRFKSQVLEVKFRGRSIDQVLNMTVREALSFFSTSQKVRRRLILLDQIGLGYLRLGQPATTLSGGEAQRIKIAAHLASRKGDRILYVLDEPTTGLHFDDITKLVASFNKLLQAGHSLVVIEHNLDIIKTADWVIDLGPEGGEGGGSIVTTGTPEQVALVESSHTGRFLRNILATGRANVYASS